MTFNVLLKYEAAFGAPPDEEMLQVFAGAAANGVGEKLMLDAISHVKNAYEHGQAAEPPGKAVAKYMRYLYRKGFR